jgi:polysaccharide biosynthesis protein PslH
MDRSELFAVNLTKRSDPNLERFHLVDPLKCDRLLMIVPVMPSDRGNGLAMRMGFFLDAYSRRFDVDLVIAPPSRLGEMTTFVRSRARRIAALGVVRPDTHYALVAAVVDPIARVEAFRRYGSPSRAAFFRPLAHSLDYLAKNMRYRVVHVSRVYLAEIATPWLDCDRGGTRLILDCDENEASVFRRFAIMHRRRNDSFAADWADAESEAYARFSAQWLPTFDLVFAGSDKEVKSLSAFGIRARVAPNTAPAAMASPRRRPRRGRPYTIVFVGTMSYAPNADAVTWFVSRVWRRLQRMLCHRVRLIIIGGSPPAAIARLRYQRGIKVTGPVSAVAPYYREADLVIAPILAGGGTRIKIIEAATHGVPVVATRLGAEGTTFLSGRDMLMADDEANFLRACRLLARNGSLSRRLAVAAHAKVRRDYAPAHWQSRVAGLVAPDEASVCNGWGAC